MKKFAAIILTFSLIFLAACASEEKSEEATSSNTETGTVNVPQAMTTAPTTQPVIISEWDSELLPDDFPAPPEGTYGFRAEKGNPETDEGEFTTEWTRIIFTCPETNFFDFTNGLIDSGYTGSLKLIKEGEYYSPGYKGFWQNGEYIVRINDSYSDGNLMLTVVMDIVPCTDNFPEALEQYFPKFNGYTAGSGDYCAHDVNGNAIASNFNGKLHNIWHWEFRFLDGFVGVTYDEFEAYYTLLGELDFSGVISQSTVDDCNVISVDVTKEIDGTEYGVYMLFNQNFRTLDIAYTNDTSIYKNSNAH